MCTIYLSFCVFLFSCKNNKEEVKVNINHEIIGEWVCQSISKCGSDEKDPCNEIVVFNSDGSFFSNEEQYGTFSMAGDEYILCTLDNICDPIPFIISNEILTITLGGDNCFEIEYTRVEE